MACEDKAAAFKAAIARVTADFKAGLADTAGNLQSKARTSRIRQRTVRIWLRESALRPAPRSADLLVGQPGPQ